MVSVTVNLLRNWLFVENNLFCAFCTNMLNNAQLKFFMRISLKRFKRFSISVPLDLAEWLEEQAGKEARSRNNLIVKILRDKQKETAH